MTKKLSILLLAIAFMAVSVAGCEPVNPEPPVEEIPETPEDLEPLKSKMVISDNWIFEGQPVLTISSQNPNEVEADAAVKVYLYTDKKKQIDIVEFTEKVPAGKTKEITVQPNVTLEPGFYKATCAVNGKIVRSFVFGVSPSQIVSAPDKQPDFDEFWQAAKDELAALDMNATLTEITSKSSSARKVYLVEMQSVPDSPGGEPVIIRGYYLEPQDGEKHPVMIHFFGYDDQKPTSKLSCPSGGSSAEFAEFYLSTRGQILNNRPANLREPDGKGDFVNTYGDWFAYNFGNRDGYYYRGAFMDCVQAVRFMATRPTSDMANLFAEGSSQGGAFSYAAAALSDYPFTAIAPCVAFLGDFPDYFDIVSWPGNTARDNQGSMTDEEMFAFLSYFDTKNLATRINAAVIACSGLQDGTCPPHTNLAPFNNLPTSDKEMYYYPEMKHEIPSDWSGKYRKFFKERIK